MRASDEDSEEVPDDNLPAADATEASKHALSRGLAEMDRARLAEWWEGNPTAQPFGPSVLDAHTMDSERDRRFLLAAGLVLVEALAGLDAEPPGGHHVDE